MGRTVLIIERGKRKAWGGHSSKGTKGEWRGIKANSKSGRQGKGEQSKGEREQVVREQEQMRGKRKEETDGRTVELKSS